MAVIEEKRRLWHLVLIAAVIVSATTVFLFIGALGPVSSQGTYSVMYMCVVPNALERIRDTSKPLLDEKSCRDIGRDLHEPSIQELQLYPPQNVIFYAQIPHITNHVMTRLFHFLITNLGVKFTSNDYTATVMKYKQNTLRFEVALGHRQGTKGKWERMATGNVTRTLTCQPNHKGLYRCDHLPLFELGSCHFNQYIINLAFPTLPLAKTVPEYSNLAPIAKLHVYEVHQNAGFTRMWLILKSLLLPVSAATLLWFRRRLGHMTSDHTHSTSPIEKLLSFLGTCLVFYNVPFEFLSLYFDCPWLLVFNDFRQGLFIAALFSFWIVFVEEHRADGGGHTHFGCYWKQMGVVSLSCIFLFVYEFCERGIQVVYPFYSIWGNWLSTYFAWFFITIAGASAILYTLILLSSTVKVYWGLRKKQKELSSLSPAAQERYRGLLFRLKFFLMMTVIVALCSVGTVVLPTEIMLHQWQHGKNDYSIYSALLTGNYGMWNAYTILMMVLYAPTIKKGDPSSGPAAAQEEEGGDNKRLQQFLTKQSQE